MWVPVYFAWLCVVLIGCQGLRDRSVTCSSFFSSVFSSFFPCLAVMHSAIADIRHNPFSKCYIDRHLPFLDCDWKVHCSSDIFPYSHWVTLSAIPPDIDRLAAITTVAGYMHSQGQNCFNNTAGHKILIVVNSCNQSRFHMGWVPIEVCSTVMVPKLSVFKSPMIT